MQGFFQGNKSPSPEAQTLRLVQEQIAAFHKMSPEVQANSVAYYSYLLNQLKLLGQENVAPQSPQPMTRSLSCTR